MKAKQDFEVYIDKAGEMASAGNLVKVKKGEEVGRINTIRFYSTDFLCSNFCNLYCCPIGSV